MSKYLLTFFLIFNAFATAHQYSKVRVYCNSENEFNTLFKSGINYDLNNNQNNFFDIVMNENEFENLKLSNLKFEILINDLEKYNAEYLKKYKLHNSFQSNEYFRLGSMSGYLTSEEIYFEIDRMIQKFPNLIFKTQIGTSYECNEIFAYQFGSNSVQSDPNTAQTLITAYHHANEPGGAFALVYYLWDLLKRYDSNDLTAQYILENRKTFIIPVVNPDGVKFNEKNFPDGGGIWRKNRRLNSDSTYGVDLNRNYGPEYAWNAPNNGSSILGYMEIYRGESPFSEPETQAVRDFMTGKNIKLAVNLHTYGKVVVVPFSYSTTINPDSIWYRNFLTDNYRNTGYVYGLDVDVIKYPNRGTSDDFMYLEKEKFSGVMPMTYEIGAAVLGFWQPIDSMLIDAAQNVAFFDNAILSSGNNVTISDKDILKVEGKYFLKIKLQNIGYNKIDNLKVKLKSKSDKLIVDDKIYDFGSINRNESLEFMIEYFPVGIDNGANAKFELETNIGYIKNIDFEIPVYEYQEYNIFDQQFTENWDLKDGWNFKNDNNNSIVLSSNIDENYKLKMNSFADFSIPESNDSVSRYLLKFDHWIEIETNYDFGLIWTKNQNGNIRNVKFGEYMVRGSNREGGVQNDSLWGFHGMFRYWMPQTVFLNEFNDPINQFSYNLLTDNGLSKKGWKIRNLKLRSFPKLKDTISSVSFQNITNYIYPNPVRDYISFPSNDIHKITESNSDNLSIFNIKGECILKFDVNNSDSKFDVSKLQSGVYYLLINNKISKFIKE
jgi:hypothetical protein